MRHLPLITAVASVPLLLGATVAPAATAPPDINRQYCQTLGGTYTSDRGVKSCTVTTYTVEVEQLGDGPAYVASDHPDWPYAVWEYYGSYQVEVTVASHTTESQLANRPITTTSSTEEVSRVLLGGGCRRTLVDPFLGITLYVDDGEYGWTHCQEVGLFDGLGTPASG